MSFSRITCVLAALLTVTTSALTQSTVLNLDILALIRECERTAKSNEGVFNYTFTQKRTIRSVNKRGEVTKEEVTVSEAYPSPNQRSLVLVTVSENGKPHSPQRIAQERQRAAKQMEEKPREAVSKQRVDPNKDGYFHLGVTDFLRAGEFTSPRYEQFRNVNALVLDFRPRPDFRPMTRSEAIITNLIGVVWIDAANKNVMRLEAYPREGYKVSSKAIGLSRPDAAIVFELTRRPDGALLLSLAHFDTISTPNLFNKTPLNITFEYSDYRRFNTNVENYELDKPKSQP